MRTQKSIEWLSGYVYNTLENKCFKILQYNNWDKESVKVPLAKVLFGLSASKSVEVTIDDEIKEKLYFTVFNDIMRFLQIDLILKFLFILKINISGLK
jgi:hypothetical protein